jgi:arylsulfatase A-like enzyme
MRSLATLNAPRARALYAGSAHRWNLLCEGLLAGIALAFFDWLATGVERVTPSLLWAMLAFGLLTGFVAGGCAAFLGRRGLGLGLVVLVGGLLHASSTYTKSIGSPTASLGSLLTLASLALACVLAAAISARTLARKGGVVWPALVVAAIPLASVLWATVPHASWSLGITCALPLAVAAVWAWGMPAWVGAFGLALASCAPLALSFTAQVHAAEPVSTPGVEPSGRPNVVLIVVDTLRYDHAFPTEPEAIPPTIARLAKAGVRFDQAVSSAPWTLPSISSLMTSLHPSQHGAVTRERRLPDEVSTLAELLRDAGYQTAAFTGGGFVAPTFGMDQGFESFEPLGEYEVFDFPRNIPLVWRLLKNRWLPLQSLVERIESRYGGVSALSKRVAVWMRRRDPNRPFFLFVHTYQVHDYFTYDEGSDGSLSSASRSPGVRDSIEPEKLIESTQEQLDWCHAVYQGRVALVDRELGGLVDELERGAGPRGLVGVLTSDHGEGFDAARKRVHHGARLQDDLLRVPLVLWAPGRLAAGRTISEQVRLLDVMPTVLDLAGLAPPSGIAGRSLLPLVAATDEVPRVAWSEDHILGHQVALRTATWKTVEFESRLPQVFRLDQDPLELHPLHVRMPEDLMAQWADRKHLLELSQGARAEEDAAVTEQLDRLGY